MRAYRLDLAEAVGAYAAGEIEAQLETLREHSDIAVFVVPAVWVTYVAIVAEILFMIRPIALYYYSAYGPSLNFLHTSSATAWLPQFFLPHFSETSSPVLNAIPAVGQVLILAGVVLFLASFAQLYFSKLRGGRLVTRGPYALTPHPQYVALAIAGLGTLLIWPRFIVLVAYVTTLFLYAALARSEEGRCLARFGESYPALSQRPPPAAPRLADCIRRAAGCGAVGGVAGLHGGRSGPRVPGARLLARPDLRSVRGSHSRPVAGPVERCGARGSSGCCARGCRGACAPSRLRRK